MTQFNGDEAQTIQNQLRRANLREMNCRRRDQLILVGFLGSIIIIQSFTLQELKAVSASCGSRSLPAMEGD